MRSKRSNIESKAEYADGITVRIFQMKSVKESFCMMNPADLINKRRGRKPDFAVVFFADYSIAPKSVSID